MKNKAYNELIESCINTKWLGYGNPTGQYIFIGIEQGLSKKHVKKGLSGYNLIKYYLDRLSNYNLNEDLIRIRFY